MVGIRRTPDIKIAIVTYPITLIREDVLNFFLSSNLKIVYIPIAKIPWTLK